MTLGFDDGLRLHDPAVPRLRQRQLRRRPPGGPRRDRGGQRRAPDLLRRGRLHRAPAGGLAGHFGERRGGVPGLQRHRRQRDRPAVDDRSAGAAVICRGTAHINTDENGAPERVGGPEAADRADPGRQAHPRADRPRGLGLGRRAPRAAAGRVDHPDHRARHLLHPRGDHGDRGPRARARDDACTWTAPGWSTPPPLCGRPVAGVHHRRRRRRPVASAAPRTACCSARRRGAEPRAAATG